MIDSDGGVPGILVLSSGALRLECVDAYVFRSHNGHGNSRRSSPRIEGTTSSVTAATDTDSAGDGDHDHRICAAAGDI